MTVNNSILVFNVKLYNNDERWIPIKSKDGDACFDLKARDFDINFNDGKIINTIENGIYLKPNDRVLIKTGVFLELKCGWEAQIRPRSGIALKHGITISNSPGTIDFGFRNEIGVVLKNGGGKAIVIKVGDRIAQMAIKKVPDVELRVVEELNDAERGMNGFGSTGV